MSKKTLRALAPVVLVAVLAMSTSGCNLWGKIDNPGTAQDIFDKALVSGNAGDCNDAINNLQLIANPSDDQSEALGWAFLCQGGATAAILANSIYSFTSGGTNFTSLGTLARNLLPGSGAQQTSINNAIATYGQIRDPIRRALLTAVAQLTLSSWLLASQSPNDGIPASLNQSDIAPPACASDAANCSTSTNCQGVMSGANAALYAQTISNAANSLSSTGAANLLNLANQINAGLSVPAVLPGTTATVQLCFIFNSVIPNP